VLDLRMNARGAQKKEHQLMLKDAVNLAHGERTSGAFFNGGSVQRGRTMRRLGVLDPKNMGRGQKS